jgi:hypothetical protein
VGDKVPAVRLSRRKAVNLQSVQDLAAGGVSRRSIAKILGFNRSLFETRTDIQTAAEQGESQLEAELASRLLEKARNGDLIANIYLTKARCGWSDQPSKAPETEPEPIRIYLPANGRE